MDAQASKQKEFGEQIERILSNFKKDPSSRKTAEYHRKRISELSQIWKQFTTTDEDIQKYKTANAEHPYFKMHYFMKVKKIYEAADEALRTGLQKVSDASLFQSKSTPDGTSMAKDAEQSRRIKRQESMMSSIWRIIEQVEAEANITQSKAYYAHKLKTLAEYWSNIATNHSEIMASSSNDQEDEAYVKTNAYIELEDVYQRTAILLQEQYDQLITLNTSQPTTPSTIPQPSSQKMKLPQIKIPLFNGDYSGWRSFHDLYHELIHKNDSLGNAQKMFYLKANLVGEPSSILKHLQITDENYHTAWELLTHRYNNTRLLVSAQLQILLNQPNSSSESAEAIKKIHDTTKECILAIKNLDINTSSWDPIIIHIISQKLDKVSHQCYEQSLKNPREVQKLDNLLGFLETRFQTLETIGRREGHCNKRPTSTNKDKYVKNYHVTAVAANCPVCKGEHNIHTCGKFLSLSAKERIDKSRQANLCLNCLRSGHSLKQCKSWKTCRLCLKKHNTLLHLGTGGNPDVKSTKSASPTTKSTTPTKAKSDDRATKNTEGVATSQPFQALVAEGSVQECNVLLATALIKISSHSGQSQLFRALIDQGSQSSFVTEDLVQRLRLPRKKIYATISGVGGVRSETARSSVQLDLLPRFTSSHSITTNALVLSRLTKLIPYKSCKGNWKHLDKIILADPSYNEPGPIDIILGADVYGEILLKGLVKGPIGSPIAQRTKFGWIVSGREQKASSKQEVSCLTASIEVTLLNIDNQLRRFWEIEEISERTQSDEDKECERHFRETHIRNPDGTYTVRLPFDEHKRKTSPLGNSKGTAVARLLQLEKRFQCNKSLESEYRGFLEEYARLGHMRLIDPTQGDHRAPAYYLPHHPVVKSDSATTKLRVVFNASSKSSSGISLNDQLLKGPTLQQDLHYTLLRWRKHFIALSADIEKMYRQIRVAKEDQAFQRILWRSKPGNHIEEFMLTTVTYGTKPASYLAVRTLKQLAEDENKYDPKARNAIMKDFYVDDFISGSDTFKETLELQSQVAALLARGGFHLRKWASNSAQILKNISETTTESKSFEINPEKAVKALGIFWNPTEDAFHFKINIEPTQQTTTKRSLLSEASKIFDPLGWFAPVIVQSKILFQELWLEGLDWDQELPPEISSRWVAYRKSLPTLEVIKIPRWINYRRNHQICELHGFCDSSEKAYAAAIYARMSAIPGNIVTMLLTAKTKVAPINKKITLPRLELCGAVLLAKLFKYAQEALELENVTTYAWTDSTIVLGWLKGNPAKWKTFVANRVATILEVTSPQQWHHVQSQDNPADCATRGLSPSQLIDHSLWWEGPKWLRQDNIPVNCNPPYETPLEQKRLTAHVTIKHSAKSELISKFSTLTRLSRTIAYCLRFVKNCRANPNNREKGPLQACELDKTMKLIIRIIQEQEFKTEFKCLKANKMFPASSKILKLNPFLDSDDIIRVGGRLRHSNLEFERKHPIILPYKGHFTTLVINAAHREALHGGLELTLNILRQKYWVINGPSAVRKELHKCVKCYRFNARRSNQIMADLPRPRVTIARPFVNTGVDYAGPIELKMSKLRSCKIQKGYIAIFICLATKAIHVELVSELTADAFMAAFKRFTSRRGNVRNLYSDNGTNFVAANKILKLNAQAYVDQYQKIVFDYLSSVGTNWHFIPPASPHFGGLWEAGVKSIKGLLRRTIGDHKLTFEEMTTVLTQIEACLNSRPLCPTSDDSDDLDALTPGHFLIGCAIVAPPMHEEGNIGMRARWQLLERMMQHFWRKWSADYIHRLQQRPKWTKPASNIKIGEMVLIRDEQMPPTRWPLARVISTHPGSDGLVRVVTLKTKNGTIKRPIAKISSLPITDNENIPETTINKQNSSNLAITQIQNEKLTFPGATRSLMPKSVSVLLRCLILIYGLATASKGQVQITSFSDHPGIYFEEIGRLSMVNNEWNIISFYDLDNYWKEFSGFEGCIQQFNILCSSSLSMSSYCNNILTEFQHHFQEMKRANVLLYHRSGNEDYSTRRKRAPLDIIGSVANSLFGLLDHEYAKHIEHQIEQFNNNEHHLLQLIRNQTSISESTLNIISRSQSKIQGQFTDFQKQVTTLKEFINELNHTSVSRTIEHKLSSLASYLTLIMINYQRTQDSLLSVVMDIHHGRINSLLLTPDQIRSQLSLIKSELPPTMTVPYTGENGDLLSIYRLLTARTRVSGRYLIFDIKLPLASNEVFQLFQIIPVPTPHADKFIFIEPSTSLLVVSLHRDRYYPMSEAELARCNYLYDENFLCKPRHPMYTPFSNVSRCEIGLLNHEKRYSDYCQYRVTTPSKVWIQLHNPNSWIYVLDEATIFNVVCGTRVITQRLEGDGILKLQPNCKIRQKTMTISSHNLYPTRLNSSFTPAANITQHLSQSMAKNQTPIVNMPEMFLSNELTALQKDLGDLKSRETLPETISIHDVHHYAVSYLILACLLFTGVYILMRRVQTRWNAAAVPKPAPRHSTALSEDFVLHSNIDGGAC